MGLAAELGVGGGLGVRVGDGLGEGLGVGACDGLGKGLGEAVASGVGDGLLRAAAPAAGAQPATATMATTAASLIPTGNWNARTRADVTPGIACTAFTISAPVSGLNENRGPRELTAKPQSSWGLVSGGFTE